KTRTLTLDTGDVTALSVDANAHQLVTRHGAELIRLWTTSDDAGAQRKWEKRNRTTRIALSALCTRLAFVSSGLYRGGLPMLANTSLSSTPALPSEAVTSLAFLGRSDVLVVGTDDGKVIVLNADSENTVDHLGHIPDGAWALASSSDGRWVAAGN